MEFASGSGYALYNKFFCVYVYITWLFCCLHLLGTGPLLWHSTLYSCARTHVQRMMYKCRCSATVFEFTMLCTISYKPIFFCLVIFVHWCLSPVLFCIPFRVCCLVFCRRSVVVLSCCLLSCFLSSSLVFSSRARVVSFPHRCYASVTVKIKGTRHTASTCSAVDVMPWGVHVQLHERGGRGPAETSTNTSIVIYFQVCLWAIDHHFTRIYFFLSVYSLASDV